MKETNKFKIWKFKKYKLNKIKTIGLFNLININKKEKNGLLNVKKTINQSIRGIIYFGIIISIVVAFIIIENNI
jgi:hypothetical protein